MVQFWLGESGKSDDVGSQILQYIPSAYNPGQRVTERAIKSLFGNGDQEHGGAAISLRGTGSVSDANLGGVDVSRCSVMTHRRGADERCQ